MYLPHDVFKHILSFKDPTKQVGVKGGIKTDSARAMPWNEDLIDHPQEAMFPLPLNAMWIKNHSERIYHGEGQTKFVLHYPEYEDFHYITIEEVYWPDFHLYVDFDTLPCTQQSDLNDWLVKPASDLWLQCEACGPDLELYAQ